MSDPDGGEGNSFHVAGLIPGSSAESCQRIRPGDVLLAIDHVIIGGTFRGAADSMQILNLMIGPVGTQVQLRLLDEEHQEEKIVTLVRCMLLERSEDSIMEDPLDLNHMAGGTPEAAPLLSGVASLGTHLQEGALEPFGRVCSEANDKVDGIVPDEQLDHQSFGLEAVVDVTRGLQNEIQQLKAHLSASSLQCCQLNSELAAFAYELESMQREATIHSGALRQTVTDIARARKMLLYLTHASGQSSPGTSGTCGSFVMSGEDPTAQGVHFAKPRAEDPCPSGAEAGAPLPDVAADRVAAGAELCKGLVGEAGAEAKGAVLKASDAEGLRCPEDSLVPIISLVEKIQSLFDLLHLHHDRELGECAALCARISRLDEMREEAVPCPASWLRTRQVYAMLVERLRLSAGDVPDHSEGAVPRYHCPASSPPSADPIPARQGGATVEAPDSGGRVGRVGGELALPRDELRATAQDVDKFTWMLDFWSCDAMLKVERMRRRVERQARHRSSPGSPQRPTPPCGRSPDLGSPSLRETQGRIQLLQYEVESRRQSTRIDTLESVLRLQAQRHLGEHQQRAMLLARLGTARAGCSGLVAEVARARFDLDKLASAGDEAFDFTQPGASGLKGHVLPQDRGCDSTELGATRSPESAHSATGQPEPGCPIHVAASCISAGTSSSGGAPSAAASHESPTGGAPAPQALDFEQLTTWV